MKDAPPSLILATSNGTGMGHLARQLAVGLAAIPKARVTLFSLSVALPTATEQGIPGEFCPGPDRGWIPESSWPHYLAGRLTALAEEVNADLIVFDGVAPYRGFALARDRIPETAFAWFRRGMWQQGVNAGQLWKSGLFDLIIEPGDLARTADRGPTANLRDAVQVPPVSLLEVVERLPRQEAAKFLGLDSSRRSVLLTLGTGRLGDVTGPGEVILNTVLEYTDWQVCVATSAIAETSISASPHERVTELRGVFPLVRYLSAFDAVISAAGYNAVHEYIPAGLPTLLVPNRLTRTDDQVGRSDYLARTGLALTPSDESSEQLSYVVRQLLDREVRSNLQTAIRRMPPDALTGGASSTAALLAELAVAHAPAKMSLGTRFRRVRDNSKETLKRQLGTGGTNRVRRLLGRPPIEAANRLRVVLDDSAVSTTRTGVRSLRITSEVDVSTLLGTDPIEHIVSEPSDSYLSARRRLIDRHYEVVSPV